MKLNNKFIFIKSFIVVDMADFNEVTFSSDITVTIKFNSNFKNNHLQAIIEKIWFEGDFIWLDKGYNWFANCTVFMKLNITQLLRYWIIMFKWYDFFITFYRRRNMLFLSENLKKYRILKNLTQEDVAGYLGITSQSVSKWERGVSHS